jgi:hypothetical protein
MRRQHLQGDVAQLWIIVREQLLYVRSGLNEILAAKFVDGMVYLCTWQGTLAKIIQPSV